MAEIKEIDTPLCGCIDSDVEDDFNNLIKVMGENESGFCHFDVLLIKCGFDRKYALALLQIADGEWFIFKGG